MQVNEVVSKGAFEIADVRMNDLTAQPVFSFETTLPMRPVKLNPGDILALEVTIKFPDVYQPGAQYEPCSGFSFDSLPVRFTVLGTSRQGSCRWTSCSRSWLRTKTGPSAQPDG